MIRRFIHNTILSIENFIDRNFGSTGDGRHIDSYIGYSTPDHIVLRGRVLSKLRHADPRKNQSKFKNVKQIIGMFLTDEVRGATVRCGDMETSTDEEGYFELKLPHDGRTGWSIENLGVEGGSTATPCHVLSPRPDARFVVISDIDDTMMKTGAYSLLRNLYTSFTGNYYSRTVFPDAVELMAALSDGGRNPVYYVSSSPWNMHDFLSDIFEHSGLVRGPKFLRDLGISETKFITEGHGNHKGASIDTILAANPDLPAILLGDTGQHDAKIYHDVINRHKDRIIFVGLRTPGNGLDANDHKDLAALAATGVPHSADKDFDGFLKHIRHVCPDGV